MKKNETRDVQKLHRGAFKALKTAVKKALAQHELAGVPAAIWRDGKVVFLSGRRLKERR
jgi:hypothetical protein